MASTSIRRRNSALAFFMFILFFTLTHEAWSQTGGQTEKNPRIAVLDFAVESGNPRLEYLGKGFAEFIGVELTQSNRISIIERSKRNELIEELNLGLTGLVDEERQIQLGNILQADYLLMGSLFDIENTLFITYRLVATEDTRVVLHEKLSGTIAAFESLSAEAATQVLGQFGIIPPQALVMTAQKRVEREEEAAVRFSQAIDAIDRGDEEEARKELNRVREIAPDLRAVRYYLDRLSANTAKFKVIPEPYYSMQNPAYLGSLRTDRLFLSVTGGFIGNLLFPVGADGSRHWRDLGDDWNTHETETRIRTGYLFPLGRNYGLSFEGFYSDHDNHFKRTYETGYTTTYRSFSGAALGLGSRLGRFFTGVSASVFDERGGASDDNFQAFSYSFTGGAAYVNESAGFSLDTLAGWSSASFSNVDPITEEITMQVPTSLYNENTMTLSLFTNRTFLITKQINDVYLDREEFFLRLLPVIEHYPVERISVRVGLEGSLMRLNETDTLGYGILAGTSVGFPRRNMELDITLTYRQRPSRVIEGKLYSDIPLTITLSKTGLFTER